MADRPYQTLTVYSATWCPDCRQAKAFLDEHGVDYELIEIDKDPAAAVRLEEQTGKRGILYFVLDDERWVRAYVPRQGFDREGWRRCWGWLDAFISGRILVNGQPFGNGPARLSRAGPSDPGPGPGFSKGCPSGRRDHFTSIIFRVMLSSAVVNR
ncbi:MAG: glutaredoxin family protein [Candidatus Krumholzibacteriia bacterium]